MTTLGTGTLILGAGMTGLAAGVASGSPVLEAAHAPGGICRSYYLPADAVRGTGTHSDAESYRFEVGGGHWIFGGDPLLLDLLDRMSTLRQYARRAAVFFASTGVLVPYPVQNHLHVFGAKRARQLARDVLAARDTQAHTMSQWLEQTFGPSLCELFFHPFHQRYTAGLWDRIAPQDAVKSPVDRQVITDGATGPTEPVGYNTLFRYPVEGLDAIARRLAARADITYGCEVISIDTTERVVHCADGRSWHYERLLSTLPLHRVAEMTDLGTATAADPCTSVLVLNIGAIRGPRMPDDHWIYTPDSVSGFHRVGFYSNVDQQFVSGALRGRAASLYVEFAYRHGTTPTDGAVQELISASVRELTDWGWIGEVRVVDPTWIDVAYTWRRPRSTWVEETLDVLRASGIHQVGRYARWRFQGIAESLQSGFAAGAMIRQADGTPPGHD
ncbi:FAD-dependent oxidoreductase [Catellatospora sp. NPDC049111]|uniref:FAD-dependent oxidoreductase n=1 Tax=Catellatospora sp. NPDC049111 TaxID=3155271 RepID=UPI0033FEFC47